MSTQTQTRRVLTGQEPAGQSLTVAYIPCLDGLRGVCLALVLAVHNLGPATYPIGAFFSGAYAVDIFFMISGYLITMLLLNENDKNGSFSLPRFYMRRVLRILPAFYFFLAGTILWRLHRYGLHDLKPYGWAALYLTCISFSFKLNLVPFIYNLNHLWSLAIEEKFYAIWPLLLRKLKQYKMATILAVIAAFYAIKLAVVLSHVVSKPDDYLITQLLLFMDPILFGLAAAFLLRQPSLKLFLQKSMAGSWLQLFLGAACLAAAALRTQSMPSPFSPPEYIFYWTVQNPLTLGLATVFLMTLLLHPDGIAGKALSVRPLAYIGILSYGCYLWHETVHEMFCSYLGEFMLQHPYQAELLQYVSILLMGFLSYQLVEKPFLKLKSKFGGKAAALN